MKDCKAGDRIRIAVRVLESHGGVATVLQIGGETYVMQEVKK
ncbi:hypothetical protein [Paenibacillus sabinae]|nr:hypothetical protein [Paenibacillus sabinae]